MILLAKIKQGRARKLDKLQRCSERMFDATLRKNVDTLFLFSGWCRAYWREFYKLDAELGYLNNEE